MKSERATRLLSLWEGGRAWGASALLALVLAACSPTEAEPPISEQWRNIEISAEPVQLGADEVGALKFRGGLALSSRDRAFGGFSGLEVLEDGGLVAISDRGAWLEAHIQLDEHGALAGLAAPRMALLRGTDGAVIDRQIDRDSEGLAQLPDGRFAVSFEQSQTILIYDLNRDGPFGAAAPGPPLAEVDKLAPNVGLEALASDGDAALIAGAERGWDANTRLWRAPVGAVAPTAPSKRYQLDIGFGLVGLDRMPDGDYVALERFYAPVIGVKIHLERIAAADLASTAPELPKTELAAFQSPLALDNFEGVSAVRLADGTTRLYIISDDNFSPRQRTLLYAFDIIDAPPAPADIKP